MIDHSCEEADGTLDRPLHSTADLAGWPNRAELSGRAGLNVASMSRNWLNRQAKLAGGLKFSRIPPAEFWAVVRRRGPRRKAVAREW